MLFILLVLFRLSMGNENSHCYLIVHYSNGSSYRCLDEECSIDHVDLVTVQANRCRTNYLSLKYSSYRKYFQSVLSHCSLSSSFSSARPNVERLLQIELLSPLENASPFQLNHLRLLTNSTSNIDTYELLFHGNIAQENSVLFIDKDTFMSHEQEYIDTLRLIFNCTSEERVEWELVKSISSLPQSPCPQQIQFKQNNSQFCLNINILVRKFRFLFLELPFPL